MQKTDIKLLDRKYNSDSLFDAKNAESTKNVDNLNLKQKARVVIVGAGLAGLAAAQRLYESGVDDVIILEALDRIGGRVHTINHADYLLEMGAQWLHGAEDNPLYQWLASEGMLNDFEDGSLGFKGIFCTSSGQEVTKQLVEKVINIACESKLALSSDKNYLESLSNFKKNEQMENNDKKNKSIFKNADQVFRCHLEKKIEQDNELSENESMVHAIFEWFLRYETIENCCDDMKEVSVQSYTDWDDLGEGTLLNFKHGYSSLLKWFSGRFPKDQWLHLNKQVLNIELVEPPSSNNCHQNHPHSDRARSRSSQIIVKYKETLNFPKEFPNNFQGIYDSKVMTIDCEHVIVTTSIGFLKKNFNTFFTPALPQVKQDLIQSIGFGTVNKIVLNFERPFWSQSGGGNIKLLWNDEDFDETSNDPFPNWCRDILSFDLVRRQPNLLIGWIGGRGARSFEKETDRAVGVICVKILQKFLPKFHEQPTRLISCICSRWYTNPFTLGSYSFQSMNNYDLNIDKLHEPIYGVSENLRIGYKQQRELSFRSESSQSLESKVPRIMFAGEATAGKLYSTAHGAIISGWREADRMSDHLSNANS